MAQLQLETDLRRAIERREFEVHYQPIVALRDGGDRSASRRWCAGTIPSAAWSRRTQFIRAAEETGLIVPLGKWVLEEACRQLADWRGGRAGLGAARR